MLRRRRRLIVWSCIVGTALPLLASFAFSPQYTAKAQIVFEPQGLYPGDARPFIGQSGEEAALQTHITSLTARSFLKGVLDSLSHDANRHAASPATDSLRSIDGVGQSSLVAQVHGWLARLVNSRTADNQSPKALEARRIDEFIRHVSVLQQHDSNVIEVTFSAKDPYEAALVANRVVQLYIADEDARRHGQASRDLRWVDERIPQVRASFERAELGRETVAAGQIYERLLQRREQLRNQQEISMADLRILSFASPPDRPSSASPFLFIMPSLVLFCIGSSFAGVALEGLDRRMHSARDINDVLGLPCVGLVPLVRTEGKIPPQRHLLDSRFGSYAEAIRSVVTALQPPVHEPAPKVLLITSSLPNEGKTTLATSIAAYAARIGRRALLIDLDVRNPAASPDSGASPVTPSPEAGSPDEQPATGAVRYVPALNIHCLTVRGGRDDPLLPFLDGRFGDRLHQLRDDYDCIVIDGPALLSVTEARLLARIADTVLLAVKWRSTPGNVAQDALSLLYDPVPSREGSRAPVSAVLTQVDLKAFVRGRYPGWECVRELDELALRAQQPCDTVMNFNRRHLVDDHPDTTDRNEPANSERLEPADGGWREGLPLPLLVSVLGQFRQQNISYCYWKSTRRVLTALSGEADLDLLVAPGDQHRAQAILLACGLKLFPDVASRSHPSLSSYLGYDESSGRIVHVHLHFRLVTGEPLLKNYRLPWEQSVLDRAIWHPTLPIRLLDPASEAILLVARAAVEQSWLDPVALRHHTATSRKFALDRDELAARLDPPTLGTRAGEIFADDLAAMAVSAIFDGRPLEGQRRLRRRLRRELAAHRTYNAIEARLRGLARAGAWALGNLNRRILHTPRPWSRRAPGGGRVVAVVGVDGSGKSTAVSTIRAWLQSEIDIMPTYFGTGDGRPSLLLMPLKMLVPLVTLLFKTKPRGASHGRISDRPPGLLYSLLMMVWATAVAAEKRIKLRTAHRGAGRGLVVVADRYPQNEDAKYSDGPLLPRLTHAPGWLRRFEARSYALAGRLPPDLVLKLVVTPDTAARREPDMDRGVIRQRIDAVHKLSFPGARVVRIDAERPLEEVIRSVKREIWSLL